MKKGTIGVIISLLILLIIGLIVYFSFFFYYTSENINQFKSYQKECIKTKFLNDADYTLMKYTILGKQSGRCKIKVEAIDIKEGSKEKENLEGKSMICLQNIGDITSPEEDLYNCHGLLKEEIQTILINSCHSQLVLNLDKISSLKNNSN